VALTGKQKAAMLLMSLDAATAAELLRGVDAEVVQELAVELASLDAAGYRSSRQSLKLARQFFNSLQAGEGFRLSKGSGKKYSRSRQGRTDPEPDTGFAGIPQSGVPVQRRPFHIYAFRRFANDGINSGQ
jgi:hypothetical protein